MDVDPLELQSPDDVPQEVRPAPRGFYQRHIPVRSRELEDQARDTGAASDVEQRSAGLGNDGEEHERFLHQMAHSVGAIAVGGETPDSLPPFELIEIRRDLGRERWREDDPERLGSVLKGAA